MQVSRLRGSLCSNPRNLRASMRSSVYPMSPTSLFALYSWWCASHDERVGLNELSDVNYSKPLNYVRIKADPESSPKKKSAQASEGKRLETSAKVTKTAKKKQPATTSKAKGLNVLSEVALSEAEQMKLATKRSKTQFHSSHASGSGADEGTGVTPGVLNVPTYDSDNEQISWKSSEEDDDDEVNMSKDDDNPNDGDDNEDGDEVNVSEDDDDQNDDNADSEGDDDQDDDNEQTESDNDDDDLVHPKLSTFDEKERQDEEDKEEEVVR
ncbi:hypothetical protein Tco_1532739 [Tanacetum coccineum]